MKRRHETQRYKTNEKLKKWYDHTRLYMERREEGSTDEIKRDKERYDETRRDEKISKSTLQFPSSSAFTIIAPQLFPGMPLKSEGTPCVTKEAQTTLFLTTSTWGTHNRTSLERTPLTLNRTQLQDDWSCFKWTKQQTSASEECAC